MQISGKIVLITGGSSGLGWALTKSLLTHNQVIIIDLATPKEQHPNLIFYSCDLTQKQTVLEMVQKISKLDILIFNAGITSIESVEKIDLELHEKIFQLNYFSPLTLISTLLPKLSTEGQIVGISTIGVFRGVCGAAPYFASKSALNVMLESYRLELKKKKSGISVTLINPGFIKTKMSDGTLLHHSFVMEVEVAAKKILKAIHSRQSSCTFPWPMKILTFLNRLLPNFLFDRINARTSKLN